MIDQADVVTTAIKLFSTLLLVLGIFMGSFYLLRRMVKRDGGIRGRSVIRMIDRSYIGVKKSVALVEVPGKILVLGITDQRISLLAQIEDPVRIKELRETNVTGSPGSFSSHLSRLLTKSKDGREAKKALSVQAAMD